LAFALPASALAGAFDLKTWRRIAIVSLALAFPLWLAIPDNLRQSQWAVGLGNLDIGGHSPHLGAHPLVMLY